MRTQADVNANGVEKWKILAINNGGVYIDDQHLLQGSPLISHKMLPEATTQPKIKPRLSILHTQAASSKASNEAAWNYAAKLSNGEAHFYGPDSEGAILQAMPLNIKADSQYKANLFTLNGVTYGALSMETQDNGSATLNNTSWNWPQIGTICAVLTAECFWYEFSCGPVGWYLGQGISQHNAFPNEWSLTAHSCPGTARTKQMDGIRQEVANRLVKIYQDCNETCPGM